MTGKTASNIKTNIGMHGVHEAICKESVRGSSLGSNKSLHFGSGMGSQLECFILLSHF